MVSETGNKQSISLKIWSDLMGNYERNNGNGYFITKLRGYVQITWRENYAKFSELTGEDLIKNPELALDHNIALYILLYGFKHGTFTGKKITDYININGTDFLRARRCINGNDQAMKIAKYAEEYLLQL